MRRGDKEKGDFKASNTLKNVVMHSVIYLGARISNVPVVIVLKSLTANSQLVMIW